MGVKITELYENVHVVTSESNRVANQFGQIIYKYSHPGLITARIAVPSYCAVKFWCGVLPYFIIFQSSCIHGMYGCMLCICPSSRNTRKQLKTLYETQCGDNQADDLFTRIYRIIKATSLNTAMRTKRRPKSR